MRMGWPQRGTKRAKRGSVKTHQSSNETENHQREGNVETRWRRNLETAEIVNCSNLSS
jgi:hypothetical protein